MGMYWHIVMDKNNVGRAAIMNDLQLNGLQTAESRGITLAAGSRALQHHRHVFLWDDSVAGTRGRLALLNAGRGTSVEVIVNWNHLTRPIPFIPGTGTLRGDGGHHGPPGGISSNGAWAYPGDIPREYIFIVGRDSNNDFGYPRWMSGEGWP